MIARGASAYKTTRVQRALMSAYLTVAEGLAIWITHHLPVAPCLGDVAPRATLDRSADSRHRSQQPNCSRT
jgi:hypothetical protein